MNATTERPVTHGIGVAIENVPDPVIKVREVGQAQEWVEWHISQNLTDRWGDLNFHNAANKPLDALEEDRNFLEHLRAQMWEEETFIVRKDGKYGILFEVEFCSRESEEPEADMDADWYKALKPHAQVVAQLLKGMAEIAPQYPGVQFAVPEEQWIVSDRPAAWAYVSDGLLNNEQRNALGNALMSL